MTDTTNPTQSTLTAPVIFLDTNAVHFGALALSFGLSNTFDIVNDFDNLKAKLEATNITAPESYIKGANIIRYLRRRSQDSAVFYYSPMTRLELLCNGLRGEAITRAAAVGTPYRWFSRFDDKETRTNLEPDGYTLVQARQANIETLFDNAGITLNEQPIDDQVWDLARALLESVFIDIQDCLIYASAFFTQASELVTMDDYLGRTASSTNDPGSAADGLTARFTAVKAAIINKYTSISGWPVDKIVVPVHIGFRQIRAILDGGTP